MEPKEDLIHALNYLQGYLQKVNSKLKYDLKLKTLTGDLEGHRRRMFGHKESDATGSSVTEERKDAGQVVERMARGEYALQWGVQVGTLSSPGGDVCESFMWGGEHLFQGVQRGV